MLEVVKDTSIIVKTELDMQITTAKAYPRDIKQSLEEAAMLATLDEETAASCFYCLPRTDKDGNTKDIKGPSIRLAEIFASCWRNLHAATRIINNDGKSITAEGVAWDLEKNVRMNSEVKKSILNKSGKIYSNDMQIVTANAACAIALRNAIFKVIPRAFVDQVYERARKHAVGDQSTLQRRLTAVFEKFNKLGIQKENIFSFFNKAKFEDFKLEDLEKLIGIGTSIKDGLLQIDKAFVVTEEMQEMSATDRVDHLLKNKNSQAVTNEQ